MKEANKIKWVSSDAGEIELISTAIIDGEHPRPTIVPGVYHIDNIKQELLFEGEYIDVNLVRLKAALQFRGIKEESEAWHEAMDKQAHESRGIWLYGDWICNDQFIFEPDRTTPHNFSATFDAETGYFVVERSEKVTMCRWTSLCFVTYNGAAEIRCGDIVAQENGNHYAFCLPEEWHEGE